MLFCDSPNVIVIKQSVVTCCPSFRAKHATLFGVSKSDRSAFSLVELIAVVTILGILAMIIVPRVTNSASKAKEQTCFHNKAQINSAVERYYLTNGSFPNTIADLDDPDIFPDGIPDFPVSGVSYALNGTTKRVQGHDGVGKGSGHP